MSLHNAVPGLLVPPYCGKLVDLLAPPAAHEALLAQAAHLPRIQLSERSLCDLELLATGAFSPLSRFMEQDDYHSRFVTRY